MAISQDPGYRFYCSVTYVEMNVTERTVFENERLLTPPCQCVVLNKKEKQRCHFTHFGKVFSHAVLKNKSGQDT